MLTSAPPSLSRRLSACRDAVVLQGGGGGTSVEAEKKLAAMSQLQYDYSQLQKELKALHEQIDDSKGHESMIRSLSDAKIMLQATRSNTADNMQLPACYRQRATRRRDNETTYDKTRQPAVLSRCSSPTRRFAAGQGCRAASHRRGTRGVSHRRRGVGRGVRLLS